MSTTSIAGPASGLALHILPSDAREDAEAAWLRLEASLAEVPVAASWDWTGTWLRHYGDLVPHRFVIGQRGGEPRAVALVTEGVGQRRGPLALATRHLGTAGEPPAEGVDVSHNGFLAEPGEAAGFARALLDELQARPGWDEIRIDAVAPAVAEAFLAARPDARVARRACCVADLRLLRATHGAVLPGIRGRRQIRRSIRRLGEVRSEWAETRAQALDIFEELVELHQRRWRSRGLPGVFASERFAAFHREFIDRAFDHGRVAIFRARTADATVGCSYGFIDRRRILSYQGGMGTFDRSRISAGTTTELLFMEESLRRGYDEHDLLAGDSEWKLLITNATRELLTLTLRPRGLRRVKWSAVDTAAAARRRIRQQRAAG